MTVVLVHGVPETTHVWDQLREELGRSDVVTPALPGFESPRPGGFDATKEDYVAWLVAEIERMVSDDGPVDLVGHDWGGGFTVRLVSTRPDLVRSWVTDAAGIGSADFEWHDFAKIWQTPGAGEEFWDQQLGLPDEERAAVFEASGVPKPAAVDLASRVDRTMADCILDLYRSAVDVGKEWGPDFVDIPAPGLVLAPSDDPFLSEPTARAGADRAGARVEKLDGVGHWWMLQDPARGARVLEGFWTSLD
jgi:pimeloyl-ACP methyl ester carboxylesterase